MKSICNSKKDCTGCGACLCICPSNAISLKQDENGFYKPSIDKKKCVNCGKCTNVCPIDNYKSNNIEEPKLYAFLNNKEYAKKSATAGAFQILARKFILNGGKVAGAIWDENWSCKHVLVDNEIELKKLFKSKYVQSYMENIFKTIEDELKKGINILFSGVPCQIAGLYSYLNKAYENLYTVDLLCNNAPSQKHFNKFLDETYGIKNISEIDFRFKPEIGECEKMIMKVATKDNENFYSEIWSKNNHQDYFYHTFVLRMLVGNHCENCHFAKFPRIADITLGDIFGAEQFDSRYVGLKTQSVIVNSLKGEELFDIIKNEISEIKEIPLDVIKNMHPVLTRKWEVHPLRDRMFKLLRTHSFKEATDMVFDGKFDIGVVGVPTNPNFGGGLTYLALKWALEDMGKSVLMISPPGPDLPWLPKRITNFKTNPYKDYEMACYPTKEAMQELNFKCNMFLAGSDQLFSTHFGNFGIYNEMDEFPCLDWVWDSRKKSAYSASFGNDDLICPIDMKNRMRYFLKKFDNFSVRERSAVDLCEKEFDFRPDFVLDPVFICDKSHYNSLIQQGKQVKGIAKYVLDMTKEKENIVQDISKKYSYEINNLEDAAFVADKMYMEDWISTIATSDYLITDSFHGTCFAIIFNKPFITFVNKNRGLARFKLLEEFGLSHRLVYSYEDFKNRKDEILKPINWQDVNSKVEKLKQLSISILKEAIKPKKKEISDYDILNEKYIKLEEKFIALLKNQDEKIEELNKRDIENREKIEELNKKYIEDIKKIEELNQRDIENREKIEELNQIQMQQNIQLNEKLNKIEKMIFKSKWFSKTHSLDDTYRIINILGFTIKQRREK